MICVRLRNKWLVELRPECSSPDLQYFLPVPLRRAVPDCVMSAPDRFGWHLLPPGWESGGGGVARGLLKTPVFPCHHDLVGTPGSGLGAAAPGAGTLTENCGRAGGSFDLHCHRKALDRAGMSAVCFGPAVFSTTSLGDHRPGCVGTQILKQSREAETSALTSRAM